MQRSIENPRFGMLVFGASMLCNTVGNYVLIFGKLGFPALGVTGAAAATLLSRVVEFALAFGYALRCRTVPLQWSALLRPGREMLRRFVHYSAPVLANETLWGVGYSLITVIMGHMAASGDLIAAYTVAGSIDKLSTAGIYGIANAAAVIVGKEIGIGSNRESVVRIGKAVCLTAFLFALALGGVELLAFFTLLRPYVLPLFSLSAGAAAMCAVMVYCYAGVMPLHGFSSTMVVGVLRGGGDVRYAMLCDVGPLYAVCLPLATLTALVWKLDIRYVYPLMSIDVIVQIFLCVPRLRSGKWIHDVTRSAGELEA